MLYIDLRPSQTCHSKDGGSCIFRWPVMGRDCVGELGRQYGTGLKSHGAVTNWCTRKRVSCMTVFFRSMTIKHAIPRTAEVAYSVYPVMGRDWVSVKQLYNPGEDRRLGSWGSDQLERRCCPREARPPAPCWAAQENEKETRLWPVEWGSICCSYVRSPTPSHIQPFQIKW